MTDNLTEYYAAMQAGVGTDPLQNLLATLDAINISSYMGLSSDPLLGPTIASMLPTPPKLSGASSILPTLPAPPSPSTPTGQIRLPRLPALPGVREIGQASAFPGIPPGYNPFR